MAGISLGSLLPAASAAEESPPPKRPRIAYLSEVKEEDDDTPAQVAMVTEEDGAPRVALITQDGAQQVQALGWGRQATVAGILSILSGQPYLHPVSHGSQRAEAQGTKSSTAPLPPPASSSVSGTSGAQLGISLSN